MDDNIFSMYQERRVNPVTLSETQLNFIVQHIDSSLDEFKKKLKEELKEELKKELKLEFFTNIGRAVYDRVLWIIGAITVGIYVFLKQKGLVE